MCCLWWTVCCFLSSCRPPMLSMKYDPRVIVPTEWNCRANTFPKYNTHSAGVPKTDLWAICTSSNNPFYDRGPLCRWCEEPMFKMRLKTANVKYNNQLHIGLCLNCQAYMIFTYDPEWLHSLFCRASYRTAVLQAGAVCSNTFQQYICFLSHSSEPCHLL